MIEAVDIRRRIPRRIEQLPASLPRRLPFSYYSASRRGHFGNQPVVEFLGGIIARGSSAWSGTRHFNQPRQVAARPDRNGDMGDIDAEDFDIFLLHAEPVDIRDFIPDFERDDEVDPFFAGECF